MKLQLESICVRGLYMLNSLHAIPLLFWCFHLFDICACQDTLTDIKGSDEDSSQPMYWVVVLQVTWNLTFKLDLTSLENCNINRNYTQSPSFGGQHRLASMQMGVPSLFHCVSHLLANPKTAVIWSQETEQEHFFCTWTRPRKIPPGNTGLVHSVQGLLQQTLVPHPNK